MSKERIPTTPALLCSFLLLAGCGSTVDGWQIADFTRKCESHGGIERIDTFLKNIAVCRDGFLAFYERAK